MRPSPSPAVAHGGRAGLLAAVLATLAAAGCNATPDPTPRPAAVTPRGGPAAGAAVTISGAGFFPRVVQSASGGPASLDTTHRAWLDDVELADVTWVDTRTLRATIPPGLALGPHELSVENAHGHRGALADAWTVIQPSALTLAAALAPATASVGQPLVVSVTAGNQGGVAIRGLVVTVSPAGAGAVAGDLSSSPLDLEPGGSRRIDLALSAAAPGAVALGVKAVGVEAESGRPVEAAAPDLALLVEARAALRARLSIPSTIAAGATFTVTMLVENGGGAAALEVAPDPLVITSDATGTLLLLAGPAPASADVPAGGQATFTWSYQLAAAGTVRLRGGASGRDSNDGGLVVAAPVDSKLGGQLAEVGPVATDPLGDGTPVAALAVRGGKLFVGPSSAGTTFWQLDPATGAAVVLPVEIAVDLGATPADNLAWRTAPPATTFGAPACGLNTTTCGPSNETGRGLLAAGAAFGDEWLVYGPGVSVPNESRYLYAARQDGPPIPFSAIDLGALLPNQVEAPTAVAFAPAGAGGSDRIYLALAVNQAQRSPFLVALSTAPVGPVLDAVAGTDALELGAADMPGIGGAAAQANTDPQPRLEALAWFQERLHLASGNALVRATVAVPRSYATAPSDWVIATPSHPSWSARRGLPASTASGLTPASRAVPAMVAFGVCGAGPCLLLARNVVGTTPPVVGQLWACRPDGTGDADACDPGDWTLAAPNQTGDPALTQLGDATNGAVSVLLATSRHLYLGFDNAATGVQLYRAEIAPASIGDFRGRDDCLAGTAGCQGLGGNGLGAPGLTRFFDARAVTSGGATTVFLAAGDGSAPLRLFALPE